MPVRTCLGCAAKGEQSDLVRLAVVEGKVVVSRTASGRGGWLHRKKECLDLALKKRAFGRAFRGRGAVVPGEITVGLTGSTRKD